MSATLTPRPRYVPAVAAPDSVRDWMVSALLAIDPACPLCGDTMAIDGPLPTRPRLCGPITAPRLTCWHCFGRLKADCVRRSVESGGRFPMPIVENESEVIR